MGRRALHVHIRQVAHINIALFPLYKTASAMFPQERARRPREILIRSGGFTLPGHNCVWSVDGYCKLEDWGFEIYAAIDAFSRYIYWSYVGISARTERSVLEQYLAATKHHNCTPLIVRSDKGVETTSTAAIHLTLSQGSQDQRPLRLRRNDNGHIFFSVPGFEGAEEGATVLNQVGIDVPMFGLNRQLELKDVWTYGKSTKNQRIEA